MTALQDARSYIGAAYGPQYDAWMALDDSTASKTLVAATRYIDAMSWQGTATGMVLVGDPPIAAPTALSWPRTGVYLNGALLDPLVVPDLVVKATYELAVMLYADPSLAANADGGSNVQSLNSGGSSITFFRPTSIADGNATVLPTLVNRLIGRFLASAGGGGRIGGLITGGSAASNFRSACSCAFSPCACAEQWPGLASPL